MSCAARSRRRALPTADCTPWCARASLPRRADPARPAQLPFTLTARPRQPSILSSAASPRSRRRGDARPQERAAPSPSQARACASRPLLSSFALDDVLSLLTDPLHCNRPASTLTSTASAKTSPAPTATTRRCAAALSSSTRLTLPVAPAHRNRDLLTDSLAPLAGRVQPRLRPQPRHPHPDRADARTCGCGAQPRAPLVGAHAALSEAAGRVRASGSEVLSERGCRTW